MKKLLAILTVLFAMSCCYAQGTCPAKDPNAPKATCPKEKNKEKCAKDKKHGKKHDKKEKHADCNKA